MKDAIEAGAVDPRSSMGVLFRNEHAKGTPDGDAYLKLKREETMDDQNNKNDQTHKTRMLKTKEPRITINTQQ